MSGHNRWSKIQHKKGAADAKRSALFTKLIREMTVAARAGGGNLDGNPRLRVAVNKAREGGMSLDNIERAIKRGTGELEGVAYEELRFEGFLPGGVACIIDCLSDNRNRTTAEIRHLLGKHGGNLGTTGSVVHMFQRKGVIEIASEDKNIDEDKLTEAALDLEADDVQVDGTFAVVYTDANKVNDIGEALKKKGFPVNKAEARFVADVKTAVEGKTAETVLKLYELLEDHDDVQNVYANFDISDEEMERIMS